MKITWTHDSREIPWPPSFEKKVEIFYHRTLGWQLYIADIISNGGKPLSHEENPVELPSVPHSGFAVLQICLSYFETIAQYQSANPQNMSSTALFREGVRAVFPELAVGDQADVAAFLDVLWVQGRNGLYHVSMTRGGIGLGQPGNDIAMAFIPSKKQLVIDPHVLPKALISHLKLYCDQLLDPQKADLRQRFEAMFDKENGL
jgi:hypothetical protein